jgi:hypothetical protein
MSARLRHASRVDAETLADDLILMNPETRAVVVLNGAGRVVWEALAEGATAAEVAGVFQAAFPEAGTERVERDVAATIARLRDAGLVVAEP